MKKYSLMFLSFGLFSGMIFAHGGYYLKPNPHSYPSTAKIHQSKSLAVTATMKPGSLKTNIERIANENGWNKVVWNARDDYNWVTHTKIRGQNLAAVMVSILEGYPLQAIFYQGNRVLVIEARTMR